MPKGLKRFHGGGEFHFITCSCYPTPTTATPALVGDPGYHRRQFLQSERRKDLFLKILEEVRVKYQFIVAGYVVMPEHLHLLIGEPVRGTLSLAMQVLKQRVSCKLRSKGRVRNPKQQLLFADDQPPHFWQPRSHDFNVYSRKKYVQKLRYIHRNPVKRGLVSRAED